MIQFSLGPVGGLCHRSRVSDRLLIGPDFSSGFDRDRRSVDVAGAEATASRIAAAKRTEAHAGRSVFLRRPADHLGNHHPAELGQSQENLRPQVLLSSSPRP
jgi:hypothetical protein